MLELPNAGVVGGESESSVCEDLSPVIAGVVGGDSESSVCEDLSPVIADVVGCESSVCEDLSAVIAGVVGGESSVCEDLSPVRRGRLDVDDATLCPPPMSRRVDSRRLQRQSRYTQVYSTGPDRSHNRSVVYINMLAVSGGTGPGRA